MIGTIFKYLDKCATDSGKRLLRSWLCTPLMSPKAIADRLNAIEDLESASDLRKDFMVKISKLPDLERVKNRMFSLAIKQEKKI